MPACLLRCRCRGPSQVLIAFFDASWPESEDVAPEKIRDYRVRLVLGTRQGRKETGRGKEGGRKKGRMETKPWAHCTERTKLKGL